jgi:hypothetical protein
MKRNTNLTAFCAGLLLIATSAQAALNFEISGVQTQIAGTTTDVTGSGSSANYSATTTVGDYAVFDIQANDGSGGITSNYAQLKVTYLTDGAEVGSNIMIAQTSNSQGLTDSGTLSILTTGDTAGTVTLQFDWYTFGSFIDGDEQTGASLLNFQVNYTALDIDYNQVVSVPTADIDNYTLETGTFLTATDDGTSIAFTDNDADTTVTNPKTAVSFTSNTSGSQQISMGKQDEDGNALFIFEFRDPGTIAPFKDPQTTPVPEPAAAGLLIGSTVVAFAMLRRRKRN